MTKARDTANLIATGVPNSLITLDAAEIPNLDTAKVTTGTFADARISAGSVTQHVTQTDLTPVRQDVLTLGLKQAVQENSTKFNLANSSIIKFEADADFNLGGSTNITRNASEFISTAGAAGTGTQTFTSGTATWSLPAGITTGEILIVSGGASGARSPNVSGGGGGAGGIAHIASYTFTATDKSSGIVYAVGAGGNGLGIDPLEHDGGYINGGDSTFAISGGTITSKGGGGGGGYGGNAPYYTGFSAAYFAASNGGSGGGGGYITSTVGTSNQGSFSGWTTYGNSGGQDDEEATNGGGGGGAGAVGGTGSTTTGGAGGAGQLFSNFTSYGSSGYFAGGGGGGGSATGGTATHGGGAGAGGSPFNGANATDGTGSGGGGSQANGYATYSYKAGDGGNGFIGILYNTQAYEATATALGTTNVPSSAVTDVSGVMLLKDAYGTTTLGTDVKVYFTANNSAWTEATSYADAGTFSDTTKMIKLGKTTCTSGSDVRWKVVYANQSASKVAEIYGIGLNY